MRKWITARLVTLTWVYFTLLFIWLILRLILGDRYWATFVMNSVVWVYFVPLPLVPVVALMAKRRKVWIGLAIAVGLWIVLYGRLYLPPAVRTPRPDERPTLTVMTYNVLTFNQHPQGVIEAIRAADADLVALQELSPLLADAFEQELSEEYPYRMLAPDDGYEGLGLLSRYPLADGEEDVPELAFGPPQVVTLDFEGTPVTVFHFHAHPPTKGLLPETNLSVSEWEAQMVAEFIQAQDGPLVLPTDLNATDQHTGYRLLTLTLNDTWRDAGWGAGHTYPGASQDGEGSPLDIAGLRIPSWLVRIDYVFVSDEWQTLSAEIGPWDGVADHRPVVVTLRLADAAP